MKKTDRRVRRTRRNLREALIDLIVEKGFAAVTIRDITDRADVAYATFFRHYESKEALLAEQIDLLIAEFEQTAHTAAEDHLLAEGRVFFEHVAANQTLYRSLLESGRPVMMRLKQVIVRRARPHAERHYAELENPTIPMALALNHMAAAAWELVAWWLEADAPLPPADMARCYQQLVIEATWWAVGRSHAVE